MSSRQNLPSEEEKEHAFTVAIVGTIVLAIAALVLGRLLNIPFSQIFQPSINDVLIGVIATTPLVVFLWWFSNTTNETLTSFRHSQIEFFSEIGFDFTMPRIIAMSIVAGVGEELLFRGVFQTWLASFSPVIVAIIVSNFVFGLLHMRNALYAVIAGLVGIYLGVLFAVTGNLLAAMVCHGLYDFAALIYTRRAVEAFRSGKPG